MAPKDILCGCWRGLKRATPPSWARFIHESPHRLVAWLPGGQNTVDRTRTLLNRMEARLYVQQPHTVVLKPDPANPSPDAPGTDSREHIKHLLGRIKEQKNQLLAFSKNIETEFLFLGSNLQKIAQQLNLIRKDYASVLTLTSGQSEDESVKFSFKLLQRAEDLVFSSYDQYGKVSKVCEELRDGLSQTRVQEFQIQRILAVLPAIVSEFRIQSSAFDSSVRQPFFTLAEEIDGLCGQVRKVMDCQFVDLAHAQSVSEGLKSDLASNIQKYTDQVDTTLDVSRNHLQALSETMANSSGIIREMTQHSNDFSSQISKIVMALQCQDITRQKIEHVGQALDEVALHLEQALTEGLDSQKATESFLFVAEVATIQHRQVRAAFEQLEEAARQVVEGMNGIETEVTKLAQGTLRMGQISMEAGIVEESMRNMEEVLGIVRLAVEKTGTILTVIAPLENMFTARTQQIFDLAQGVRLVAVNARIYAAHVPGGASLDALAQRTRSASDQTVETVAQMENTLQRLATSVQTLEKGLVQFQNQARQEQESLTGQAMISHEKMASMQQELPAQLNGIQPKERHLTSLVKTCMDQVHFPQQVEAARSSAMIFFRELAFWSQQTAEHFGGHAPSSALVDKIAQLRQNYTMAEERDIHENSLMAPSIAGLALAGADAARPADSTGGAESSSIELFDDFTTSDLVGSTTSATENSTPAVANHVIMPTTNAEKEPSEASLKKEQEKNESLGDNVELF